MSPALTLFYSALLLSLVFLINAQLFRAAVFLFNRFAGDSRVKSPSFGRSCSIILNAGVISFVADLLVLLAIAALMASVEIPRHVETGHLPLIFVTVPINFVVFATVVTLMLPASFGQAMAVTACQMVMAIAVVAILVMSILGISHIPFSS